MQKKKMINSVLVSLISILMFQAHSQIIGKEYKIENFQIKSASCSFTASEYNLVFRFKPRIFRTHRLLIIDKSSKKIADIKTAVYHINHDSISIGWYSTQWDRGHNLYNICFEDFKTALNSDYKISFIEETMILENEKYKFILKSSR